jgi:hypothetical protein
MSTSVYIAAGWVHCTPLDRRRHITDGGLSRCINEEIKGEERMKLGKKFHTLGEAEQKPRPLVTASSGLMKEVLA